MSETPADAQVSVCAVADLEPGEPVLLKTVPPISVWNVDGVVYAIDDTCSHAEASLADGDVEGCLVECPFHMAQFDLRTGEPEGLPATVPVRTHAVEIRDGMVTVLVGRVARPEGTPVSG